jgi:hypothetical protein
VPLSSLSHKPGIRPHLSETRALFQACDLRVCKPVDFEQQALSGAFSPSKLDPRFEPGATHWSGPEDRIGRPLPPSMPVFVSATG